MPPDAPVITATLSSLPIETSFIDSQGLADRGPIRPPSIEFKYTLPREFGNRLPCSETHQRWVQKSNRPCENCLIAVVTNQLSLQINQSEGRRSRHGVACSYAWPRRNTVASAKRLPAIWRDSGRPLSPKPQHTDIAGLPVTLNGIVRLGRSRVTNLEPASIRGASLGTRAVIYQIEINHGAAALVDQLPPQTQGLDVFRPGD